MCVSVWCDARGIVVRGCVRVCMCVGVCVDTHITDGSLH